MRSEDPPNQWWRIDPDSGARLGPRTAGVSDPVFCLADAPLDEADMVADMIDAAFGSSRYFSHEEVRKLVLDRVVPGSVRPYEDAATELLEAVEDLWRSVDECYRQAWGRPADEVERRFIADHAFSIMRRK